MEPALCVAWSLDACHAVGAGGRAPLAAVDRMVSFRNIQGVHCCSQPAYNPEMKQKARSLAAKRAAAEGLAPTRQAPPMAAAAAAARPALKAPGSRKQLKRPFKNERPQARRQQQRPQTSRRANAAGVQTWCLPRLCWAVVSTWARHMAFFSKQAT